MTSEGFGMFMFAHAFAVQYFHFFGLG